MRRCSWTLTRPISCTLCRHVFVAPYTCSPQLLNLPEARPDQRSPGLASVMALNSLRRVNIMT